MTVSIWSNVGRPFLSSSPRIASSFAVLRAPPKEAVPWMIASRLLRIAGLVARLGAEGAVADDGVTIGETEADGETDGEAEGDAESEGDGEGEFVSEGDGETVSVGVGEGSVGVGEGSVGVGSGDVGVSVGVKVSVGVDVSVGVAEGSVWAKLGLPSIAR